jgi:hypothetical protein
MQIYPEPLLRYSFRYEAMSSLYKKVGTQTLDKSSDSSPLGRFTPCTLHGLVGRDPKQPYMRRIVSKTLVQTEANCYAGI